ncbi:MAG: MerR family transcriptional regulator [Chitinivibrionales bacterium]|nr:MerR family transcriptional regulator [Chitinivibrionales bacterium]
MSRFFTSGQVARKLRVSISTLKRWLDDPHVEINDRRNANGWRLFSERDVGRLQEHKRLLRKNGRRFNDTTLIPIVVNGVKSN